VADACSVERAGSGPDLVDVGRLREHSHTRTAALFLARPTVARTLPGLVADARARL